MQLLGPDPDLLIVVHETLGNQTAHGVTASELNHKMVGQGLATGSAAAQQWIVRPVHRGAE